MSPCLKHGTNIPCPDCELEAGRGDGAFRELVRKMRSHQKAYFKTRTGEELLASKDYERRVDKELDRDGHAEDSHGRLI